MVNFERVCEPSANSEAIIVFLPLQVVIASVSRQSVIPSVRYSVSRSISSFCELAELAFILARKV
jgi:hypothetical protein